MFAYEASKVVVVVGGLFAGSSWRILALARNCISLQNLTCLVAVVAMALPFGSHAYAQKPIQYDKLLPTLTDGDLVDVIVPVLKERLELLRNCYVKSEVRSYVEGSDGAMSDAGGRHVFEHWQLGGAYRINTDWYRNNNTQSKSTISESAYSSQTGLANILAKVGGAEERVYGRIDNQHDPIITLNTYQVFLLKHPRRTTLSIVPYLISCVDEWNVERDEHIVKIRCPHRFAIGTEPSEKGYYECHLDSRKGFLPILIDEVLGDIDSKQGQWRHIVINVSDTVWVNGVCLPKSFQRVSESPGLGSDVKSIMDVEVLNLEIGNVAESDVQVVFPPGTEVSDAIEGVTYIVGLDGSRDQVETFAESMQDAVEAEPSSWRMITIAINLAVVAFLIAIVWRRSALARQTEG